MKRKEHNEGFQFPFVEYSPENTSGKLPVIIQLHGAGERGYGKEALKLVDVHGFSKLVAEKDYNCLFIMPQCPSDTFWAARVESIIKFVEEIIEKYGVDKDRVFLTGLSMGGYGTWYTAMAKPSLFAKIAPVCGGGMPWNASVLTMPVWAFHGADDDLVTPIQSDEMINRLKLTNDDVKYTRMDGVGHDVWVYAYTQELLDWFLND